MARIALRRMVECLDGRRIPLNREQRSLVRGDVPYWGAGGVLDHVDKAIFNERLVLLGEDGAPFFDAAKDVAYLIEGPAWVNNHMHVLRPRSVDPSFLRHALNVVDYGPYVGGSTRDKLTQGDMMQIEVPYPSLSEQERIAQFLDRAAAGVDALICARRRQIELLEERGLQFERTMIAGGFSGEASDSGLPWIGRIGLGADLVPLQRIVTLQRGVDLTDEQRESGNVPVVTTAGIAGYHSRAIMAGPGVVIGRYGSAGSVHWIDGRYWPHNTTLYVKSFNGNNPRYCYYVMRSIPYEMEQARAAVPGINRNDINRRIMPLLPFRIQAEVAHEIDSFEAHRMDVVTSIERGINLLAERRRGLIAAAVSGQIDVSTASGVAV